MRCMLTVSAPTDNVFLARLGLTVICVLEVGDEPCLPSLLSKYVLTHMSGSSDGVCAWGVAGTQLCCTNGTPKIEERVYFWNS